MADKELRHMSRGELVEIIYELKRRETELQESNQALKDQLADRSLHIEQSGSIAEAAMELNQVFTAAQAAADQYLESVRLNCGSAEAMSEKILADARSQAETIVSEAHAKAAEITSAAEQTRRQVEAECTALKQKTEEETRARWDSFEKKVGELFLSYRGSEPAEEVHR